MARKMLHLSQLAGLRTVEHPASLVKGTTMLSWALTFLIVALVAGVLGLWGLEGMAMQVAWILFVVFLILFLVSLLTGRRTPVN